MIEVIAQPPDKVEQRGYFLLSCYDEDGSLAWSEVIPNGATTAGLNDMLNVAFGAAAQHASWFVGLISGVGFSATVAGDTMASHAGWSEFTGYSEANRQAWTPGAAGAGAIINPVRASMSVNANGSQIRGAFIVSDNTKGGSAGVLWATSLSPTVKVLNAGQILRVDYTTQLIGSSS
jgi:hypothetical protein